MSASELLKSIHAVIDSPAAIPEDQRKELLAAAEKLRGKLENPMEAGIRFFTAPIQTIALRVAADLKLFDAAASAEDGKITLEYLASKTSAEPLLIKRIIRVLVGMSIFDEAGKDVFSGTAHSRAYVTGSPLLEGLIHMTSQNEAIGQLPAYFSKFGYKSPDDAYDGPLQFAKGTKLHYFDWLANHPRFQHAFNIVMTISRKGRGQPWYDYYPVESKLRVDSPKTPVLVDVGGGIGHDLKVFKKAHPKLTGKLIVEDIPVVISSITTLPPGIEAVDHDFFSPQPVQNAKAYYLGNVLHDWPDKQAKLILGHIRDAMGSESVLLIKENVLPEMGVSLYAAQVDLVMMACFSALERTLDQFRELLESAGFELVKAWTPNESVPGAGTLIEAVVKR